MMVERNHKCGNGNSTHLPDLSLCLSKGLKTRSGSSADAVLHTVCILHAVFSSRSVANEVGQAVVVTDELPGRADLPQRLAAGFGGRSWQGANGEE